MGVGGERGGVRAGAGGRGRVLWGSHDDENQADEWFLLLTNYKNALFTSLAESSASCNLSTCRVSSRLVSSIVCRKGATNDIQTRVNKEGGEAGARAHLLGDFLGVTTNIYIYLVPGTWYLVYSYV